MSLGLSVRWDPVTVAGIPDTFHINIDTLPKIQLGVDPLTINPVTLHLDPIDLSMSIKEIPNIRAHLPADFTVGLSLLGIRAAGGPAVR